mmetsp:Transcript_22303/g.26828  ORF Transcript_22303/g.26828 Transcript_22303/m.26828 type:complete len:119 (-) Transcript_22303:110-466(-)|eukprot:CAMPEP_0197849352 /NCGR_PEP_ID=MMETSP1438-20131217/11703_1 /TAXON_ID=1461541 /ORGANISM="Pterosperma sp., Strain CCMP1384" /LENGTH=118 /DNA_ID=CAMNT_0043461987 /DNA_START=284 /DNA_END=640 /DNA_ORIENTATION=+
MTSNSLRNTKSMFGNQTDSRKLSSPAYGFGTTTRQLPGLGETISNTETYMTKKHAEINFAKSSPGPCYDPSSSLGKQTLSNKRSTQGFGFGSSKRFSNKHPDTTVSDKISPGPGNYDY